MSWRTTRGITTGTGNPSRLEVHDQSSLQLEFKHPELLQRVEKLYCDHVDQVEEEAPYVAEDMELPEGVTFRISTRHRIPSVPWEPRPRVGVPSRDVFSRE